MVKGTLHVFVEMQGCTQPIDLRGFQAELRGLSVNLSEFMENLRGFQPCFLAQTR